MYRESSRKKDVRTTNIEAAKAVADAVRTSLGPRGMDKMVCAWARYHISRAFLFISPSFIRWHHPTGR